MDMSKNNYDGESTINASDKSYTDLPKGIGKPALRALSSAGYLRLEQFSKLTEAEVMKLHGMGPKAMGLIREALAEKGLYFNGDKG
jgi:hypothetical protein